PIVFGPAAVVARAASRPAAPSTSCAAFSAARPTPVPTAQAPATMLGSLGDVDVALLSVFVRPARLGARLAIAGLLHAGGERWYEPPRGQSRGAQDRVAIRRRTHVPWPGSLDCSCPHGGPNEEAGSDAEG